MFVHLFTPLLVIFDYINFGGNFLGGSKYPYFFLDIEKYGISGVIGNLTFVYILFLLYGYLVYFIDKKLGKKNK